MRSPRLRALLGLLAAVMAWVVLAPAPAQAAPRLLAASKPTWASSKLSGTVTFTAATSTKHYVSIQLVRSSTPTAPTCLLTSTGCQGVSGVSIIGTPITNQATNTLMSGRPYSATLSATCRAAAGIRYYWTWARVADSTGSATYSVTPLSGSYC